MNVLIATPARLSTPRELLRRIEGLVHSLDFPGGSLEWRLHFNEQPPCEKHYEPNARARNEVIDRYLRPWHDWVFWLDADIIEMPSSIVKSLMEISLRRAEKGTDEQSWPAIVAPMVWMERIKAGPVGFDNGGWFYDTGGFVGDDGRNADFFTGPLDGGDEVVMQSVGTCYLAPAGLYLRGMRYRPVAHEVEHIGFCRAARAMGVRVLATRKVEVVHAYLPKYGEPWHHRKTAEVAV